VRPEEALALGLIHEVADNALARAKEIAAEIASFAPIAVSRAKHAVYAGSDTNLATGLDIEASAFLETMLSEDGLAAMKTYISLPYEKRRDWLENPTSPEYKGK
jgi:enoyl-CoA hydratase